MLERGLTLTLAADLTQDVEGEDGGSGFGDDCDFYSFDGDYDLNRYITCMMVIRKIHVLTVVVVVVVMMTMTMVISIVLIMIMI